MNRPTVRLAVGHSPRAAVSLSKPFPTPPALLVSFAYYRKFAQQRAQMHFRDYSLDSGAFTVKHSGGTVDLKEYIEFCRDKLACDPQLTEVFALDVIGDWRASIRNCEEMWKQGVPAIPVFHEGEPWDALCHLPREYPKIAIGSTVSRLSRLKVAWAGQCFARVWPKRVHGFAFHSPAAIMGLPWDSVDASNWEIGPACFGEWLAFSQYKQRVSVRRNLDLRAEVEAFLRLERQAQGRWRKLWQAVAVT